jgi:hypothetical protein
VRVKFPDALFIEVLAQYEESRRFFEAVFGSCKPQLKHLSYLVVDSFMTFAGDMDIGGTSLFLYSLGRGSLPTDGRQ